MRHRYERLLLKLIKLKFTQGRFRSEEGLDSRSLSQSWGFRSQQRLLFIQDKSLLPNTENNGVRETGATPVFNTKHQRTDKASMRAMEPGTRRGSRPIKAVVPISREDASVSGARGSYGED